MTLRIKTQQRLWFSCLTASLCILLIFLLGWSTFTKGKWRRYYRKKLYLPPRELIVQASALTPHRGNAIDLGCGVGNETYFLLHEGWTVWAIDSEQEAIDLIRKRKDVASRDRLTALAAPFEKMPWDQLPDADLVIASYSLPFCQKESFPRVWKEVNEKIKPGGRFTGHFFGLHHQGFSAKKREKMTFLNREQMLALFEGYTLELFQEKEEDGTSATGDPIHWHIFEVIAVKEEPVFPEKLY